MDLRALADLSDDDLLAAYTPSVDPWLRLNFVATTDGSAVGSDGLSSSINDEADGRVFAALRELADAVVVGAGTVRQEAYEPNAKPLVVVTRSSSVPPSLLEGDTSQVLLATCADNLSLEQARQELSPSQVIVLGEEEPDMPRLVSELHERGYRQLLCEGGPRLARDLLAADLVDELCLTVVPRLVAGDGSRILAGARVDAQLEPILLVEDGGTLLGRWRVSAASR